MLDCFLFKKKVQHPRVQNRTTDHANEDNKQDQGP